MKYPNKNSLGKHIKKIEMFFRIDFNPLWLCIEGSWKLVVRDGGALRRLI
jgi:hypothetical protein